MDVVPRFEKLILQAAFDPDQTALLFVFADFSTFRQDRSFRSRLAEDFKDTGFQLAIMSVAPYLRSCDYRVADVGSSSLLRHIRGRDFV